MTSRSKTDKLLRYLGQKNEKKMEKGIQEQKIEFKRLEGKTYLITISNIQNNVDKAVLMDKIKKQEKRLEGLIISQESHLDGDYHYHILIRYQKRRQITNPKIYNYILNKQTNIQQISDLPKAIEYVIKDGNFVTEGLDIPTILTTGKNKDGFDDNDIIADLTYKINIEKYTLEQLVFYCEDKGDRYVIVLSENNKSFKSMIHFMNEYEALKRFKKQSILKAKDILKLKEDYQERHNSGIIDLRNEIIILNAIYTAILYGHNRPHKTPNLHIYSDYANMGKTTLLTFLSKHLNTYYYPPIQWFAEYFNHKYNMIIWDEFKFPKDIHHFNLFFEGAPIDLSVKYSTNITKVDNPLIICSSNKSIRKQLEEQYKSTCHICSKQSLDFKHIDEVCDYNTTIKVALSTTSARIKELKLRENLFTLINDLKKIVGEEQIIENTL